MKRITAILLILIIIAGCVLAFDTPAKKLAKQTALDYAGISGDEASFVVATPDFDDGRFCYNVSFVSGTTKYEFEVTKDGRILEGDRDWIFD